MKKISENSEYIQIDVNVLDDFDYYAPLDKGISFQNKIA